MLGRHQPGNINRATSTGRRMASPLQIWGPGDAWRRPYRSGDRAMHGVAPTDLGTGRCMASALQIWGPGDAWRRPYRSGDRATHGVAPTHLKERLWLCCRKVRHRGTFVQGRAVLSHQYRLPCAFAPAKMVLCAPVRAECCPGK